MTDTNPANSEQTSKSRRRPSRRTIGKAMIVIGVVGIIVSVSAVIIGQRLVRQVQKSVDDSLVVTTRALSAVTDSIRVTGAIVDTIESGVASVGDTLTTIQTSIGQTSSAITDAGEFLGGSLPDSLSAVNNVLPTIESVASSVDDALRTLSKAPFGPNYDPAKPFDEAIAQLSDAIDPLPDQLRTLSGDFNDLNSSTAGISTQLGTLAGDIGDLGSQLANVSTLVQRYAATAADASILAQQSRQDLMDSARATRLLLVLLGGIFALGQIVPIWLGTVLLANTAGQRLIIHRPDDD